MNLVRIHSPVAIANLLRDYRVSLGGDPDIVVNLNYGVPQTADLTAHWTRRILTNPLAAPAPVAQT